MDSEEKRLYEEEQRQSLIDLNEAVDELKSIAKQHLDKYEPTEKVEVTGKLQVNTEKEVEVSNLQDAIDGLNKLGDVITKSIEKNAHKPLESVTVKNISDAKADTVRISNIEDIKQYFDTLAEKLNQLEPVVNVEKQDVVFPRSASEAIPVRLSDGQSFYKAYLNATLGGGGNKNNLYNLGRIERSRFNELLTSSRTSVFNYKPTWGLTTLRYITDFSGTGATADEVSGEFKIESGTSTSGYADVRTAQRGQYQAGAMGQAGVGVRIPTNPTSTATIEWGYTDFTNGFVYGVDATGNYVAYISSGTKTKVYQQNWNVDTLDGNGNSNYHLDYTNGVVTQIDFTWYGYGDIEFNFLVKDPKTNKIEKIAAHRFKIDGSASVVDPNQPLSFRVDNGASNTTNTVLYVGGHQFSVVDGLTEPQLRQGAELITSYTTATNTDWQPLIAVRKKGTFRSRPNSITTKINRFEVASDGNLEVRLTIGGTTSNLSWSTPTGRTASETAVETKVSGGTPLTTSAAGEAYEYGFVTGANARLATVAERSEFFLGVNQEAILWVRRLTGTGAIVVYHAHIEWLEQW